MIPRILHQIWIGGAIPEKYSEWTRSFGERHGNWSHIIWTDDLLRDILGINPEDYRKDLYSNASITNLLRLIIVHRFGGVYADVDCEFLGKINWMLNGKNFAAEQDNGRICNAFFGAEKGSEWIRWQIENQARQGDQRDAAWGVYVMSAAPRDDLTLIDRKLVYPFLWDSPPESRKPDPDSVMIHHWEGSWLQK